MKTWAVYRETKSTKLASYSGYVLPTRLKTIRANTIDEAVQKFLDGQSSQWRDEIVHKQRNAATVWRRRFTPRGLYKGETRFMIWPLD